MGSLHALRGGSSRLFYGRKLNSSRSIEELALGELAGCFRPERWRTLVASELAREHLGRPLPNAALLGGFAAQTGVVEMDSVERAIRQRFTGAVADGNVAAARAAFELVAEPARA